ncbi:piggyBac transposable element-derived protein 2-like [Dermacentor silvarum]|uniref:piggyBac transposable element-derived protein 2-like n=1 Tax=Dermacentor silvarum TaxID=543639 RepID=UPI0021009058|nr:piggyBac transposable element-derived protein 2-like [Dermacentor silvarum]
MTIEIRPKKRKRWADVDIGGGVTVEKGTLEKLSRACESGPGKFARALLRIVFTEDELRGRTLLGGRSNLHIDQPLKEALDPVRVQAVIDYTCSKFPSASISYIKNSLSSMLARDGTGGERLPGLRGRITQLVGISTATGVCKPCFQPLDESSSFFFREVATDNRSLSRVRSRQLTERTASSSRLGALEKRRGSRDSAASTADFVDETSSEESEDDFGSSDFSSDSKSGDDQHGSSTSGQRVSTTYGNDVLPPAQKRIIFAPRRAPGVHITDCVGVALRSGPKKFLTALDFFALFFTTQVITTVCENSNKYGWTKILEKPTHARSDGSWEEVTPDEMMKFIGLIIYMGLVKVPRLKLYWNVGELYSGLLPRRIMPRRRFIALLAMLHVADLDDVSQLSRGKLRFVWWLMEQVNQVSAKLFQPHRDLSIDERMVKSKGRSGIRPYMKDKVTKWGYKLWVLADPGTRYTVRFSVYTGKRDQPGPHGLAFDVVCQLCAEYLDQG